MTAHERWADAAGPYLLEAMTEAERREYEAHLATCPVCREEVEQLRPAAEALPVAATPMVPPPGLKARIMAEVEREARLLEAAGPAADRPPEAAAGPARPHRGWLRLALVAAVLLVGVLAGAPFWDVLRDGTRTAQVTVDREQAPRAHGELRMDGEAMLVVDELPMPPAGRIYQVWVVHEGSDAPQPTDALFMPREDGSAVAAVPMPADNIESVLVTAEPPGGSLRPTRTPLLSVSPS